MILSKSVIFRSKSPFNLMYCAMNERLSGSLNCIIGYLLPYDPFFLLNASAPTFKRRFPKDDAIIDMASNFK